MPTPTKVFYIEIDDATKKALEWDIVDLDIWANNAVYSKARMTTDKICKLALTDKTHTILALQDKITLQQYLSNQGIYITSISDLPEYVKKEIVRRANIQSAAERQEEFENTIP